MKRDTTDGSTLDLVPFEGDSKEITLHRGDAAIVFGSEGFELNILPGKIGRMIPPHVGLAIATTHFLKHRKQEVLDFLEDNPPKASDYGLVEMVIPDTPTTKQ